MENKYLKAYDSVHVSGTVTRTCDGSSFIVSGWSGGMHTGTDEDGYDVERLMVNIDGKISPYTECFDVEKADRSVHFLKANHRIKDAIEHVRATWTGVTVPADDYSKTMCPLSKVLKEIAIMGG